MSESLTEFVDCRGSTMKVDRDKGIIRGVKLLGPVSKNGRRYTETAIHKAKSLYEGAKVNVDHPAGNPDSPRSYKHRLGSIKNTVIEADGVYGDLHYNPKHALAEQLAWDAEHAPENVGFSHNVLAKTGKADGQTVVEDIIKVTSVDLVADPATTRGLFEHEENDMTITLEAVKEHKAILESLRAEWLAEQNGSADAKAKDARISALTEEVSVLKRKLDEFDVKERVLARKALAARLITEAKLPDAAVTDAFRGIVEGAADEAAMKVIIDDRADFAKKHEIKGAAGKPVSKSGHVTEGIVGVADSKEFAARLCG